MPSQFGNHRATVDEDGNIILSGMGTPKAEPKPAFTERDESFSVDELSFAAEQEQEEETVIAAPEPTLREWKDMERVEDEKAVQELISEFAKRPKVQWVITEDKTFAPAPVVRETIIESISLPSIPLPGLQEIRGKLQDVTSGFLKEGSRQYQASLSSGRMNGIKIAAGSKNVFQRTWGFLAQPVWVPGRRSVPKKRTRGMLFVTDVVRFGGTFATLFSLLFLTLNYQSFWQIVQTRLDPLSTTQAQDLIKQEMEDALTAKLQRVPALATAGKAEADLLSFLPPVGPPDNRIIIPKFDLNVPIVIPSNEALMREDWKALEEDIQESLQDGVVHYPGTAKPGQAGNFFLTGHSSYFPWAPGNYKSVFARLHQLNVGDEYWVFYGGDRHRYVVTEKKEVKPSDVTVLDQPISKRIGTLMTCTPIGTTLRRLIIVSQEVDATTGEPLSVGEHEQNNQAPQHKLEMLPI